MTAPVPSNASPIDEIALEAKQLIVETRSPGRVSLAMLNTHDDAYGDHWLFHETDAVSALLIAKAVITKAHESIIAAAKAQET